MLLASGVQQGDHSVCGNLPGVGAIDYRGTVTSRPPLSYPMAQGKEQFFAPLLLYGEGGNRLYCLFVTDIHAVSDTAAQDGEAIVLMGEFLPFLQKLSVYASRVNQVVKNVVHQLAMLHTATPTSQAIDARDVHMQVVFAYLARMLTVLATLDEIIQSNPCIKEHWTLYKG